MHNLSSVSVCVKTRPGHLALDDVKHPLFPHLLLLPILFLSLLHHHLSSFLSSLPDSPPPPRLCFHSPLLSCRLLLLVSKLLSSPPRLPSPPLPSLCATGTTGLSIITTGERPFHTGSLVLYRDSRRGELGASMREGCDDKPSQRMSLEERKVKLLRQRWRGKRNHMWKQ